MHEIWVYHVHFLGGGELSMGPVTCHSSFCHESEKMLNFLEVQHLSV